MLHSLGTRPEPAHAAAPRAGRVGESPPPGMLGLDSTTGWTILAYCPTLRRAASGASRRPDREAGERAHAAKYTVSRGLGGVMAGDLSWREAVIEVLKTSPEAMHYTEIAEAVAERGLKQTVGATPAQTVNAMITTSIKTEGEKSPFQRTERGRYRLRNGVELPTGGDDDSPETGLINAFGMFWARDSVAWDKKPRLWGRQSQSSARVDFYDQQGVYLLYDRRDVVYVGRTTEQPLGLRLQQHVRDRLGSRWERFSWFGVYPVTEAGEINAASVGTYDLSTLIVTMEALLIEGLEPPQNRKRGDGFNAVEFLQVEDPDIRRAQAVRLVNEAFGGHP